MPFPHRLAAAGAALAACLAAFVVLLWDIQVTNGPAYAARAQRSIAQMETVPAARGRLLDRNGTVLVQDQVTWQAQVDQEADPAVRQRLAALCREEGVAWSGVKVATSTRQMAEGSTPSMACLAASIRRLLSDSPR